MVGLNLRAALGSLVFLVLVPGTMGGLIPWWITEWQAQPVALAAQIAGFGLFAAGLAVLLEAFVRCVFEGRARRRRLRQPSGWSSEASTGTCETRCTSR